MERSRLSLAPLALAALCALPTLAVEIEPRWQPGGPEGGWVSDIAISPSHPSTVYAGVGGHVFASSDEGRSWRVTASAAVALNASVLSLDPHVPTRLHAAFWRQGVHRSCDGGRSWEPARAGLPFETPSGQSYRPVTRLVASTRRPGTLFATVGDTVYLTRDSGDHWEPTLSLEWLQFVAPGQDMAETIFAGGLTGVRRSLDGGETWEPVPGLGETWARCMAADSVDPLSLWVGGEGVWTSTDGGESWVLHTEGLDDPDDPGHVLEIRALAVAAGAPRPLVASSRKGTFLSADGGVRWSGLSDPPGELCPWTAVTLAASPDPGGPVLSGSCGRGVRRLDGANWLPSREGLHAVPVGLLALDPGHPDVAYSGPEAYWVSLPGLHRTRDGGRTWHEVTSELLPAMVRCVAVDPANPRHLLVPSGVDQGLVASTDGGDTWSLVALPGIWTQGVASILFAPSDPARVYAFAYGDWPFGGELLASSDGGFTWVQVASDITAPIEPRAAAVDPTDADVLYAGFLTYGPGMIPSSLFKSTDGGSTWFGAGDGLPTVPSDPVYWPDRVTSIAVDPNQSERVVALTQSHGLYVSEDGAASWQSSTAPVTPGGIAFVRDRPGTLLVGGEDGGGVFISEDAGQTWRPLGAGLDPAPRVLALAASPDGSLVYAGTSTSVLHLHRSTPPRRVDGRLGAPPP